ncbi:MAG: proline permease [Gemmatales bacterium]|nr:MAG: proline permease [Gemmatales bacterium]
MDTWMHEQRSTIILVCVGLYMLMCIGVGFWALRQTKTSKDFFMAGHRLGIFVTGVAVFSSTMSGFGFVGGPGLVYRMGVSSLWMVICTPISFCLSHYLLAKRLRLFAAVRGTISLPDAVASRYDNRASGFLSALAILLGVMGYLGTQILAMAHVLRSLLLDFEGLRFMSLEWCVAVSCAVLVFYCTTGGIIASVYTDLVQGFVMMIAAILVFFAAINAIDGGFYGMANTIVKHDPEAIGPWGTLGIFGCLSWFFVFTLGASGQPHVVTKMMMYKNLRDAKHLLPISVFGYAICALLWISIGLVMRALVIQGVHSPLANADEAAPQFLQHYAHPLLAGIVFAGLMAAIMSTADSFLNIGAAAIVHDIPRALRGRSLSNELAWARTATVVIAVAASFFALKAGKLVALLGAFGWGTFAAALVPAVAIGFNWKRATALAANVAIATSLIVNFSLELFGVRIPFGIDKGAAALLISLTLFFTLSLAAPPKPIARDIETAMDV